MLGLKLNHVTKGDPLPCNLRKFYACVRGVDGKLYCQSSLTNTRAGQNCFLTSSLHKTYGWSILPIDESSAYEQGPTNTVRRIGQTKHKDTIPADMRKLYESGTAA